MYTGYTWGYVFVEVVKTVAPWALATTSVLWAIASFPSRGNRTAA